MSDQDQLRVGHAGSPRITVCVDESGCIVLEIEPFPDMTVSKPQRLTISNVDDLADALFTARKHVRRLEEQAAALRTQRFAVPDQGQVSGR